MATTKSGCVPIARIRQLCCLAMSLTACGQSAGQSIQSVSWGRSVDLNGNGCVSSAQLNVTIASEFGFSDPCQTVYVEVDYQPPPSIYTWTYVAGAYVSQYCTAPQTVTFTIPGHPGCTGYDYMVKTSWFDGQPALDYLDCLDPIYRSAVLCGHREESPEEDTWAYVQGLWWSDTVDVQGNGCASFSTLNWNVQFSGNVSSLDVFEKLSRRKTGSTAWTDYVSTAAHPISCCQSNVSSVVITGSGRCTAYDYRIEIYRAGQSAPDTVVDPSNAPILGSHSEESPFLPAAGVYQGLFSDPNGPANESSGFFSASVTSKGGFSGKLKLAGKSYPFAGQFSLAGRQGTSFLPIPRTTLLSANLELDLTRGTGLYGSIDGPSWSANLIAHRAMSSANRSALIGTKYTWAIPSSSDSTALPGGASCGALTVDRSGNILFRGALGDGTALSQGCVLTEAGQWPFYAALYSGNGSILGWLALTNQPGSDLRGVINWIKWPQSPAMLYAAGFTNQAEAIGSTYEYTRGAQILNLSTGQVSLAGGNLSESFTNRIVIAGNSKVTNLSANKLGLTFATATGLFKGKVIDPASSQLIPLNGVVLQKQNIGLGYFLVTNRSGGLYLGN